MKPIILGAAAAVASLALAACSAPTTATSLEVTLTAVPNPTTASASSGVTYTVTNPDGTYATYEYQYQTSFQVTLQETGGTEVDITSVNLLVQQASGGIIITPSGGDKEYYRFNSNASGNHLAAHGTATIGFDVWYALPNHNKEALVTVQLAFVDDNSNTYSKTVQERIAP